MISREKTHEMMDLAKSVAGDAGGFLKSRQAELKDIERFSGHDVKIKADKEAESLIIEQLRKKTDYQILSEETGIIEGKEGYLSWIVDPLDGSLNYHKRIPFCCISIALYKGEDPLLGVVYDFNRGELFSGIVGEGAWLNGKQIKPSTTEDLSKAVLGTGFPVNLDHSDESLLSFVKRVQQFRKVRLFGSAALSLCYVACGRTDAYYEKNIMLWDVAAGCALVSSAGGEVYMNIRGVANPLMITASNGKLEMLPK